MGQCCGMNSTHLIQAVIGTHNKPVASFVTINRTIADTSNDLRDVIIVCHSYTPYSSFINGGYNILTQYFCCKKNSLSDS